MSAAAYWNQAMTYDQYLDQMSERRDEYDRNFTAADIGTRQRLRYGTGELRFLVITEDWCGDSSQFVPAVAKLSSEIDDVEIRFLLRPDVPELADNYRDASGRQPIPVIIALDAEGNELGHILERPKSVTDLMATETIRFAAENGHLDGIRRSYANMPDETKAVVSNNIRTWRAQQQSEFVELLFDELESIVRSPSRA